ncbi:MAG TPA: hypothetical protein VL285_12900 [Bryobacteraceae bacterium]|jgi:hypothetical protein|nr:hypothetical protein [Bryobacteraceae bacterium]
MRILLALFPCLLGATEITTGYLLGPKYDYRAFYIRAHPNEAWQKTYSGAEHRPQARGKLMNLRLVQAIYHDEWMSGHSFDPDANTGAVIAALDFYKRHGILMINVSMQGGQAGYDGKIYGEGRSNGYRYGREKGTHVSAFRPDGSLKPEWLARLDRILKAADQRGMIVNLMYFYQGQDELFESTEAIHRAAREITDWLIAGKFRNVIIDIANEWDLRGDRWDFASYIPENVLQLIKETRDRFQKLHADFALPISVSSDGRMNYAESFLETVDVALLHGNGRTPRQKAQRASDLKNWARPILMTEDDNGRESTTAHLAGELASCDAFFNQGAGWGYMPWVQAQRFPFRYLPSGPAAVKDELPEKDRDMAYFHAVLDHIAKLTMKRPPDEKKPQ